MKRTRFFILGIFVGLAALLLVLNVSARAARQQKVDEWVLASAEAQPTTEFLVVLSEQADLDGAGFLVDKTAKGRYVYAQKTAVARHTQAGIVAELDAAGVAYRRYWISNMIWVQGDKALVEKLARRGDVARIHANPAVKLDVVEMGGVISAETLALQAPQTIEWQIEQVGAPAVWAEGVRGTGVVVGGQDTGYDWTHPALKQQYRGWDAASATADHSYSWHDAIHSNNPSTPADNPCGFDSAEPCDDNGHGTHTMGTMVGDDGGSFQTGMAPAAEWIACRNMEQGWGTPATYAECYEWFVAPYPQNGDPMVDGRPELAPHVIGNSWSCPTGEGCTDPDVLREAVETVHAAGIVTVQAASNSGPGCSSINTPAAIYNASFTVGATDDSDLIAGFSSRGPVSVIGDAGLKPDLVAPGVGLLSTRPGGSYGYSSGTSMATPMVVGLAALLIDANPALAGQVEQLEELMRVSAVGLTTTDGCGGDTADAVPNHTYGYGRIDAWAAYQMVTEIIDSYEVFMPLVR